MPVRIDDLTVTPGAAGPPGGAPGGLRPAGADPAAQLAALRAELTQMIGAVNERVNGLAGAMGPGRALTQTSDGVVHVPFDDRLELRVGSMTLEVDHGSVRIRGDANVEIVGAASVVLNAGILRMNAALVKTDNVVQCSTLIATSVVASSYTPGAGNVW